MVRRWKSQRLTPGAQILAMQRRFPTLRLLDKTRLIWEGPIEPSEGSRVFVLRVEARPRLKVFVLSPPLFSEPSTGRPPHTFDDRSLCLYHTDDFWWTGAEALAETIVPWACEWCWYYEQWELTGRWLGPAYEHGGPKRPEPDHRDPSDLDRAA